MKLILLLIALLGPLAFGDEPLPPADFSTPRNTMNFFLKSMKAYKLGNENAINLAIKTINDKGLDPATKEYTLTQTAKKLIRTIDRLEHINLQDIPQKVKEGIWIYRQKTVDLNGTIVPVEISLEKNEEGQWLFSEKTVSSIDSFERSLQNVEYVKGVVALESFSDKLEKKFPKWIKTHFLGLKTVQWTLLILLIFLSLVVDRFLRFIISEKLSRIFLKQKIEIDSEKKKKFIRPFGMIMGSGFFLLGIKVIELPPEVFSILHRLGVMAMTIYCVLTAHKFVDIFALYLEKKAKESENKFDDILVPLVRKTAKTLVIVFGFIFIGDSLTIDMKGIVAGLGIGGIAFALAAKDTISNLFGSLTVLLDRPFSIGDHVVLNDKIEGTILEVGLRSTKIKTFYDSVIFVPNGLLTNIHIENYALRKFRRFNTVIGVQYDTPPEKIDAFCEGIRQIVLNHKYTRKDYFNIYFTGMGASSLDIMVYLFWEVPDRPTELQEQHRLLIDILRLGQSMEIDFAFPTQTVHLFSEKEYSRKNVEGKPIDYGQQVAQEILKSSFVSESPRSSMEMTRQ